MLLSLIPLLVVTAALGPTTPALPAEKPKTEATAPRPELEPQEVVRSVLHALRHNDEPRKDAGITTTFQFASPDNQKVTGPIEHFIEIVKHPAYRPMLGHKSAELGPIRRVGDQAFQHVRLIGSDGKAVDYDFILSRDPTSKCWLTDGVVPTPPPPPPPPPGNEVI